MQDEHWAVGVPIGYQMGCWRISAAIATGHWGSVYQAELIGATGKQDLPPRAALKFLATGTVTPRQLVQLREMAEREVHAHRTLAHPRLLRIYQVLQVDDPGHPELDGATVLVMELAAGSAADLIGRTKGAPVPDAPRLIEETAPVNLDETRTRWV